MTKSAACRRFRSAVWLTFLVCVGCVLVSPVRAADEGIACEGEPTDMLIRYGDVVQCSIDPIGDNDVFRFSGGSGETVRLQVTRTDGGTACIQLLNPDGEPLDAGICSNRGRDYLLGRTGVYTIAVSERFLDQAVSYTLSLDRVDPPSPAADPIQIGEILNDEINPVGDLDLIFFRGESGDTLRVQITRLDGGTACVQVFAPDGSPLDAGLCSNRSRDYTLSRSGTYAIVINERFQDQFVGYALTLACIAGQCPDLRLPDVAGCVTFRGAPLEGRPVRLKQPNEQRRTVRTDVRGCYEFNRVVRGKSAKVKVTVPKGANR